jgi:hypothetical protein
MKNISPSNTSSRLVFRKLETNRVMIFYVKIVILENPKKKKTKNKNKNKKEEEGQLMVKCFDKMTDTYKNVN